MSESLKPHAVTSTPWTFLESHKTEKMQMEKPFVAGRLIHRYAAINAF